MALRSKTDRAAADPEVQSSGRALGDILRRSRTATDETEQARRSAGCWGEFVLAVSAERRRWFDPLSAEGTTLSFIRGEDAIDQEEHPREKRTQDHADAKADRPGIASTLGGSVADGGARNGPHDQVVELPYVHFRPPLVERL
ncbi:MAG: hypothetical protein IMZ62_00605 [Chloroflexi bacterium]|nr:hypothetical protein [Chloroflexota bacterium]